MNGLDLEKEKVRQSVDLVDLVSEHVALKRRGRSFTGLCPFHREKTPSFSVTPDMGIFKCFGCGVGGDVFKFVQLIEKVDFMDAFRLLAERVGVEIDHRPTRSTSGPSRAEIAEANRWAMGVYYRLLRDPGERVAAGWAFLEEKGIGEESADRFGLGLAPSGGAALVRQTDKGRPDLHLLAGAGLVQASHGTDRFDVFRDRLMFPIRDAMKRVVGFGGRTLGDATAKYVNTAQNALFDKGGTLYGLDLARGPITEKKQAIVVEGYTDCVAAHQHGFANTVATLGTAVTDTHMGLLRRYCSEVVLVFDSDVAGDAAADRAIGVALEHGLTVKLAKVPEGKDPCEYLQRAGSEAFESVLNSAEDALGFKWKHTLERFRSEEGGSDRRAAMLEFVRFVVDLGRYGGLDPIQQGLIVSEIAQVVHASVEDVHRLLAQTAQRRVGRGREAATGTGAPGASVGLDRWARGDGEPEEAEQAALLTVLGVVLNEPQRWAEVQSVFAPERIANPVARSVAERMCELAGQSDQWNVSALLSSLETTEEASCLTDLLVRGASRGDHASSLSDAVARLGEIQGTRTARDNAGRARQAEAAGLDEEESQSLREFLTFRQRQAAERKGGFASRRSVEELRGRSG